MITRRELLSKAAASSILVITGCNQTSPTPTPQASIKRGSAAITRLNVFVHGLAVMEIAPSSSPADQGIILTFPNFTPGGQDNHIYKYGSVTKVSDKKGLPQFDATYPYYLKAVTPGIRPTAQDFGEPGGGIGVGTPDINIMLPKATSIDDAGQRKFILPWPEKLFPLNLMERSDGKSLCAITTKPPNGEPLWLPTTYLLTYTIASGQTPKITRNSADVGWTPASSLIPECPNLHIYAEPEVPTKSSHAVHAFSTLMGLLTDTTTGTTMDKYYKFNDYGAAVPPAKVRQIPNATIPFGVSPSPDLGQLADKRAGEVANCVGAVIMR